MLVIAQTLPLSDPPVPLPMWKSYVRLKTVALGDVADIVTGCRRLLKLKLLVIPANDELLPLTKPVRLPSGP